MTNKTVSDTFVKLVKNVRLKRKRHFFSNLFGFLENEESHVFHSFLLFKKSFQIFFLSSISFCMICAVSLLSRVVCKANFIRMSEHRHARKVKSCHESNDIYSIRICNLIYYDFFTVSRVTSYSQAFMASTLVWFEFQYKCITEFFSCSISHQDRNM